MSKRLNDLQTYYIDNNLGMSDSELAKTTGASLRQIKARRMKIVGKNREGTMKGEPEERVLNQPMPEHQAELENQGQKAAVLAEQAQELAPVTNTRPAPAMRIDALIARKAGTTSLTGPASELADMFDGIAPDSKGAVVKPYDPFADKTRVHRIK